MRLTAQSMVLAPAIRPPRPRPELATWLFVRDYDFREAALLFGCSHTLVHTLCRPWDDPERRPPKQALLERIVEATAGEINGLHFVPPHLRPTPIGEGRPSILAGGRAS